MTRANDAESSGTDLFKQGGGSLSRTAAFVDGLDGLGGTYLLYFLMMAMVEESQSNTEFSPWASCAGSPQ